MDAGRQATRPLFPRGPSLSAKELGHSRCSAYANYETAWRLGAKTSPPAGLPLKKTSFTLAALLFHMLEDALTCISKIGTHPATYHETMKSYPPYRIPSYANFIPYLSFSVLSPVNGLLMCNTIHTPQPKAPSFYKWPLQFLRVCRNTYTALPPPLHVLIGRTFSCPAKKGTWFLRQRVRKAMYEPRFLLP